MTIQEMKEKKKEKGYTYAKMAELSGVPLGTIQKIFCGETESPRYDTLQALEALFTEKSMVQEKAGYEIYTEGNCTIEDYYALPEDTRVELMDGVFYDMYSPTFLHQRIAGEIYRQIANYIMDQGGDCQPFVSPVDVQLDCDQWTMVQPDVGIICDKNQVKKWGIYGAPDFLVEIISPSTKVKDYTKKLFKYMNAGVREYWILDPYQQKLLVYFFESETYPVIYGVDQPVPVGIYEGKLVIEFGHIYKWILESENID